MTLSSDERRQLFDDLNNLVSQQFSQLLFVLKIPQGIVPPPPSPQGDRVFQLLSWAEGGGCGLEQVKQELLKVSGSSSSSQTTSSSEFTPFLEIKEDGSMLAWDITEESWREFPADTILITSDVSNTIVRNPEYAQSWKRVHTLTEALYPEYMKLHRYMLLCQELHELQGTSDAAKYRFDAATFFETLRPKSESFSHKLNALDIDNQGELVSLLSSIPICSPAISQSLGAQGNGPTFNNGVLLVERISELLLDGLHVADQLLEVYFKSIQVS